MGSTFEAPISQLVAGGFDALERYLNSVGPGLLYRWLALIFLKTHLKDRSLRFHLDPRKGSEPIGDLYEWEALHHIHCLARSFHSGAYLSHGVIGSILLVRAQVDSGEEPFDYADLYVGRTVLLRMNDACLIAVLNDAKAGIYHVANTVLPKIDGPLGSLQLRELMARLALVNLKQRTPPEFMTAINNEGEAALVARIREWPPRLYKIYRSDWARLLHGATMPAVLTARDRSGKLLARQIKKGRVSFLFDDNDRFIKESFVPTSETAIAERRSRGEPSRPTAGASSPRPSRRAKRQSLRSTLRPRPTKRWRR